MQYKFATSGFGGTFEYIFQGSFEKYFSNLEVLKYSPFFIVSH